MVMKKRKVGALTSLTREKREAIKKIHFEVEAPEADKVFLVGDFNEWNISAHPFKRNSNGTWHISIELAPGRYEYRFLMDGEWRNDPKSTTFVTNPFGSENCVVTLD